MSSSPESTYRHNNVDEIVDYLRKDTPFEEVTSTTSVVVKPFQSNNKGKRIKKEKIYDNLLNQNSNEHLNTIEKLPTGRVRYGPIIVNPRKKPSKTIFTGRRSKNEILHGEEEAKRRSRRERNRAAATKYRESREKILSNLQQEFLENEVIGTKLSEYIGKLRQRKQKLESLLSQSTINCCGRVENPSDIVPSTTSSQTFELVAQNHEEFQSLLTNSTNTNDLDGFHLNYQIQQQQQQQITINSSSLNRLLDNYVPLVDTNNNNTNSILYNSAYGLPTCAQQYSSSSSNEDDSMLSTKRNSYVY